MITGSGTVEIKTLRAGEPLKGARNYSLYSIGPDGEPEEKAILSNFTSTPTFVVPAGRYLVSAKDGTVEAKETVQVDASETVEVVLSFDTGTLKISSSRGGEPLKKSRRYQVFRVDDEDGKPVAGQFTSSPSFVLSPGDYIVSAKDGSVLVESAVTVQAGKDSIVILEFDTGLVSAKAVLEGKPLGKGGRFTVNRSGEEDKVASQFTREVSFSLPPGDYEMRFEGGDHIGEATFTIQTGKTTELEVPVTEK